jgi:hypothetical protein
MITMMNTSIDTTTMTTDIWAALNNFEGIEEEEKGWHQAATMVTAGPAW